MGTLPLDVWAFADALEEGDTAVDYIEATLSKAHRDLCGFAHPQILLALKKSPDGVSTLLFAGVENNGAHLAEPKDVAAAMKMSNAIVYHPPSGEYRLASRAHRTALLERYRPGLLWN